MVKIAALELGGEGQAGGEVPQEQQHIKIYSNKTFHLEAGVR